VEFALVLPFLLLLLGGVVEIGYGFYDYMLMVNANREGVRLGSRGRFTDSMIFDRVVAAGGWRGTGVDAEPVLQTTGDDRNFGMVLTHVPIEADGGLGPITQEVSGTIGIEVGDDVQLVPITAGHSRLTADDIAHYTNELASNTNLINQYREDQGYQAQTNEMIIVETFMVHPLLLNFSFDLLPIDNPMQFYSRSVMRVMRDSSLN
jgi:hypothetical protein